MKVQGFTGESKKMDKMRIVVTGDIDLGGNVDMEHHDEWKEDISYFIKNQREYLEQQLKEWVFGGAKLKKLHVFFEC